MGKPARYWKMYLQVLDLFKSYIKLNQYKQRNTCKSSYFLKHLHTFYYLISESTKSRSYLGSAENQTDKLITRTEAFSGH